jgi:DNA repair protein RecO (recombination protein O)
MAYCKTEGVVLRVSDYGESSQIATLFTRDFGRLHGIAKGAKRLRKGVPNALDALNRVDLVFVRKPAGQLHLFTEWTVTENFLRLRRNLDTLYWALYVAELVCDLTEETEEGAGLYGLLLETLRGLEASEDAALTGFGFEVNFLGLLGHMPEVRRCVVCGRSLPTKARFSPREGGALCTACPAPGSSCLEVSSGALATIAALARTPITGPRPGETALARRLRIAPATRREMRQILNACIVEVLGREPRMGRHLRNE